MTQPRRGRTPIYESKAKAISVTLPPKQWEWLQTLKPQASAAVAEAIEQCEHFQRYLSEQTKPPPSK